MKDTSLEVDSYIEKSAAFARPILKRIRRLFHQGCPEVRETMKWSTPLRGQKHLPRPGFVGRARILMVASSGLRLGHHGRDPARSPRAGKAGRRRWAGLDPGDYSSPGIAMSRGARTRL